MTRVKIGVLGAGRTGRVPALNLASRIPEAGLGGVADLRIDAAKSAAEACGGAAVDDYRRLLQDKSIHAVAICSSTDTHARLVEEAAAAGKHVFCEKPLDLDPGRIRSCLDAVHRAGVHLQVGFNRRFDPHFAGVRERVAAGEIGVPHILRITSRDPQPPPRDYIPVSGGLFLDMAIHDFDMARYLLGDEIEEVSAVGSVLVDRTIGEAGDVDTAITTLRFKSGALGAIDNSRKSVYGYDQRLEVFGSGGCVMAPNVAPIATELWTPDGRSQEPPHYFFIERYQEAYLAELREFAAAVKADRAPSVGGEDGLKAVLVALAAKQSCASGRPVKVSEIACPTLR